MTMKNARCVVSWGEKGGKVFDLPFLRIKDAVGFANQLAEQYKLAPGFEEIKGRRCTRVGTENAHAWVSIQKL